MLVLSVLMECTEEYSESLHAITNKPSCDQLSDYSLLCYARGLVVRVPGYISRGPGFDSRGYQIFLEVVSLEQGSAQPHEHN
jgi:hypothetical protein